MKQLYFIRHGESEANQRQLFAGRWDVPLTELGIKQARLAGKEAKNSKIDCIVTSPLLRARQTAEIVADEIGYPKSKIIISDLFIERDYGDLQGRPWADVENIDFDEVPNIETTGQLISRAGEAAHFLHQIKADNILLIGHGTSGRAIRSRLLGQANNAVEVPIEDEIPNSRLVRWL